MASPVTKIVLAFVLLAPLTAQAQMGQPAWLSLPASRLVINPHLEAPPASPGLSSALGLNLAFYAGEVPSALPNFCSWQPVSRDAGFVSGPALALGRGSEAQWKPEGVATDFGDKGAKLTITADAYGGISREVTVDLNQTPFLMIQVASATQAAGDAGWALKVNDGSQTQDTVLVSDNQGRGTFVADVGAATGWRGTRTFKVILFAVGGKGKSLQVPALQFIGLPAPFSVREKQWFASRLASTVEAPGMEIQSNIVMPDEHSVAQRLRITRASADPHSLRLTGQFNGNIAWDESRRSLILRSKDLRAVIAVNRPARWLGVRASGLDWLRGKPDSNARSGVWALQFDGVKAGDAIVLAARFAPILGTSESTIQMQQAARTSARAWAFVRALQNQEAAWKRHLSQIPRPAFFELDRSLDQGVRSSDVGRTYERAWVFLLANTLPPMPENNFPFPQCPTGKPSLWSEGAPRSRASAQWESFLAMQMLALVDAETAWRAFEGQMSLVGPDGSLGGEGLPSCHARTAWALFQASGDKARLRRAYPAIKKLLRWKIDNPRWVFKNSTPPDMKDNEFVVHALIDIQYAQKIADTLQILGEVKAWEEQRQVLAANFHKWFWDGTDRPSYRLFRTSNNERSGLDSSWNLQALALPSDVLRREETASLQKSLKAQSKPSTPFFIAGLSKFPNYQLVMRGLWQTGDIDLIDTADTMAQVAMRDITRAGEFAETYDQNSSPPRPSGVWPSVFGARMMIDATLWHNGVIADEGLPVLIGTREQGSVEMNVRGSTLRINSSTRDVMLWGDALKYLQRPRMPYWNGPKQNDRLDGKEFWRTQVNLGEAVALQAK